MDIVGYDDEVVRVEWQGQWNSYKAGQYVWMPVKEYLQWLDLNSNAFNFNLFKLIKDDQKKDGGSA